MVRTISLEEYAKKYDDLYHVAYTGDQWLGSGIGIDFELESDGDLYYLTVEMDDSAYNFYGENPDYDRDALVRTEKFEKDFQCKVCDTLDDVNKIVEEELGAGATFVEDEEGEVFGR